MFDHGARPKEEKPLQERSPLEDPMLVSAMVNQVLENNKGRMGFRMWRPSDDPVVVDPHFKIPHKAPWGNSGENFLNVYKVFGPGESFKVFDKVQKIDVNYIVPEGERCMHITSGTDGAHGIDMICRFKEGSPGSVPQYTEIIEGTISTWMH